MDFGVTISGKKVFNITGLLTLVLSSGVAMSANSLIDELSRIRNTDHRGIVEVSEIVTKYIPIGTSKELARSYLQQNGFTCHGETDSEPPQKVSKRLFTCKYDFRKWYYFGFGDEVVVNLYIDDQRIRNISAKLIYRAL